MNHGVRTYQSSCRSFEEEDDDDDEIAVLLISIPDSEKRIIHNSASIHP